MQNIKHLLWSLIFTVLLSVPSFAIMGIKAPGPAVEPGNPSKVISATHADTADSSSVLNPPKVSGVPSVNFFYEANSTDTNGIGFIGPTNSTKNIFLKLEDETATVGQTLVVSNIAIDQTINTPIGNITADVWTLITGESSSVTINDTTTSLTEVWSSSKTASEIAGVSVAAGLTAFPEYKDSTGTKGQYGINDAGTLLAMCVDTNSWRTAALSDTLSLAPTADETDPVLVAAADSTHDGVTAVSGSVVLTEDYPSSPAVTYSATNATPAFGNCTGIYPNYVTPDLTPTGTSDIAVTYAATDLAGNAATGTDLVQEFAYSGVACSGEFGSSFMGDYLSITNTDLSMTLGQIVIECSGTNPTITVGAYYLLNNDDYTAVAVIYDNAGDLVFSSTVYKDTTASDPWRENYQFNTTGVSLAAGTYWVGLLFEKTSSHMLYSAASNGSVRMYNTTAVPWNAGVPPAKLPGSPTFTSSVTPVLSLSF